MFALFLAELKRTWIQFIRYKTEAIGGIVITTVIFYGLFLSARYIVGPGFRFGDRLDAIIVGYVLWTLLLFISGDIAGGLQREAQTGTLEQVFLSPFGAPKVFLMRTLASLTIQLVLNLSVLLIIMALTGSRLSFPPTLILPFISVLLGAYGLSFITGSLALLLKQVQQLLNIFSFLLLFLIAAPSESWTGAVRLGGLLLPMVTGAGLLRQVMAYRQPLDWFWLGLAFLSGLVYFVVGLLLFQMAEREAKRRGRLGGY